MQQYDLSNLTYRDFEELCKDILQYKENKTYRTFKPGKDKGIDILSLDENFIEVGQAKHYIKSSEKNLISELKKEKVKLLKLEKMQRYLLFTSLELSVNTIQKILELLTPYLKLEDIYDNNRIQNILNEKEANYILDKWEKLWMPTPYFLRMIYEKFRNREYDYKKEEIIQDSKKFVKPKCYKDILQSLEEKSIVVIHGEPGAGKTTLARNIVANYIHKGYQFIYGHANELNKIDKELCTQEDKVIVLIDDFLGSNTMSLNTLANDNLLEEILKKCYRSTNKKIVLTTRTYIYNTGVQKLEKFSYIDTYIDKFLLTSNDYTYMEKAEILYNHLYYNGIMEKEEYKYVLEDELYVRIIVHQNFTPKTIALLCEHFDDICKENTRKEIIHMIKDPHRIWEKEYDKLNKIEKIILHIIVFFGIEIEETCVEEQFWKMIEETHMQIQDDDFQKGLNFLTDSFVKRSVNSEGQYTLQIVNNNIVDFIIQKIDKREIRIQPYITYALYIDILRNMYDLLRTRTSIKNQIVQKIEEDFYKLKHTKVYWLNNVFHILEENDYQNDKRKMILQAIIDSVFELEDFFFIEFLIEQQRSAYYEYILNKLYEWMSKNDHILRNATHIISIEELMLAVGELEERGWDISFLEDQYGIFKENLIRAVTDDIEEKVKMDIFFYDDELEILVDTRQYVKRQIKDILQEHYLFFDVKVEEIYEPILEEILKRKDKMQTIEFKQEAQEEWADLEQHAVESNYLENTRIEIVKMFENRIPTQKNQYMTTMKVESYIKIGNDIIQLHSEDQL